MTWILRAIYVERHCGECSENDVVSKKCAHMWKDIAAFGTTRLSVSFPRMCTCFLPLYQSTLSADDLSGICCRKSPTYIGLFCKSLCNVSTSCWRLYQSTLSADNMPGLCCRKSPTYTGLFCKSLCNVYNCFEHYIRAFTTSTVCPGSVAERGVCWKTRQTYTGLFSNPCNVYTYFWALHRNNHNIHDLSGLCCRKSPTYTGLFCKSLCNIYTSFWILHQSIRNVDDLSGFCFRKRALSQKEGSVAERAHHVCIYIQGSFARLFAIHHHLVEHNLLNG